MVACIAWPDEPIGPERSSRLPTLIVSAAIACRATSGIASAPPAAAVADLSRFRRDVRNWCMFCVLLAMGLLANAELADGLSM